MRNVGRRVTMFETSDFANNIIAVNQKKGSEYLENGGNSIDFFE
jgi:hypothetical protein